MYTDRSWTVGLLCVLRHNNDRIANEQYITTAFTYIDAQSSQIGWFWGRGWAFSAQTKAFYLGPLQVAIHVF